MSLSVVVITKNEEAVIGRCLESVLWADEIVVVDSGSSDRTVEVCRSLGAKVYERDWPGYAAQRNRGIELATCDWVLALDADEWVTPALRSEIERVIAGEADVVAYRMPRLSSYCGRFMRHGGWWPDYVSRLFRKGRAHYAGGLVHDHLVADAAMGKLSMHLMHEAFVDLDEVLHKVNGYSTAGAQMLSGQGHSAGLSKAVVHGLWTFFKTYVMRAGFLDGREGFMLAVSNAEGTYYKYVKLWKLQHRPTAAP